MYSNRLKLLIVGLAGCLTLASLAGAAPAASYRVYVTNERSGDLTVIEGGDFNVIATIPVGRYGKPEEYGDVVAFLASERAAYLTGSVIRVDGGMISSI